MIRLPVALFVVLLATMTGCSPSDDADPSVSIPTWTTNWGADQSAIFAFHGDHFAYLASEMHSGSFDANGDGDQTDSFPVVVETATESETQLSVATHNMVWVGDHLYLDVLETEDELDWDNSMTMVDRVLLHWTAGMTDPEYVATLDILAEIALVSTGDLAIAATMSTATVMNTPLVVLEADNPTTPVPIPNDDLAVGTRVEILELQEGLLFVGIDETLPNSSGVDHNGDGDALDERVLGLVDVTRTIALGTYTDSLYSIDLALPAGDTPLLAVATGFHDWLVAFLVDETSQGSNLNNDDLLGFSFTRCHPADTDIDMDDEVLHFMQFLEVTHGGYSVTNSGLVGGERIIHADGYLGTISREGDEAGCDLNSDGDLNDRIFRWVLADRNNLTHENDDSRLHALGNIGGPAGEIAAMGSRFVIVVNELADGRDHDGVFGAEDRDLVAWMDPSARTAWTFHHDSNIEYGWVVATWMGEAVGTSRVGIGFSEQSNDDPYDLNDDGDFFDSVPTFAYYDSSTGFMEFPGYAIGGDSGEMGIVILGSWAYYRVSEAENGGDLDGNGNGSDYLLWASHLSTGQTVDVSPLNFLSTDSVLTDYVNASCAAFLVDEGGAVGDLNGDGDTSGFAVRYLRY